MKNIKLIVTTVILATLSSCVNGDDYGMPDLSNDCVTEIATKEVTEIQAMATTNNPVVYTADDIIEAYVTSSDEGGNFYKSISLISIDGTKGFTIPVDDYNLYTKYEPGRKVYVHLKDLYYSNSSLTGSFEIGGLYNDPTYGPEIGRISGVEYKDVILRSCEDINEDDIVKNLTISTAKNDQYLNMLIEFDAVQFTDASLGKTYFDASLNNIGGATNHEITDEFGNKVYLRVSEYTTFASNAVPSFNGKIRGVMTKYNGEYQFMIRTLNDVNLTNARPNPALENFESYATNTFVFPNYFNIKVLGTNDWFVGSFSGNKYLQARKGSSSGATKIFLVMPYNFDIHTRVSFKTLYGYMSQTSSPIMKVYYSTNFNSINPTANLVDITSSFTFSNHTGTGWASTFTNSGIHTFTGMSGQGHIIFAYDVATTSTTNAETRPGAQIDNILFQ
jgi:hypothetical protein